MTEYELLLKILEEILDRAGSYKIEDLLDIWEKMSGEKWKISNNEIVPVNDSYYDD